MVTSGAGLRAGGKAFHKADMVAGLRERTVAVGRAGPEQAHVVMAAGGATQDTLGTAGGGHVRSVQEFEAWSPSSFCHPALLFTISRDLGWVI